jgi:hypothetical protein
MLNWRFFHPKKPANKWETIELFLLFAAIVGKIVLFKSRYNVDFGYDAGGHLEAMSVVSWLHPFFDLRSFFYATHPPLGFLLANTASALTFTPPLVGAQIVSFISSLAILFFLRGTLKRLGILAQPSAIAFLYLVNGLPLMVYMQAGVNLDIIIFAFVCVMLYLSTFLVYAEHKKVLCRATIFAGLIAAAACLTKVSGFLLFAILPLYALAVRKNLLVQVKRFFVIAGIAMSLVFPYYFVNYYIPEKTFFFGNAGETAFIHDYNVSKERQKEDYFAFARSFVSKYPHGEARLRRTWRSLWQAEDRYPQSDLALRIFLVYQVLMTLLAIAGLVVYLFKSTLRSKWYAFGNVLLVFMLLQVLFTIVLITLYPMDGYSFNKGIYIAPAALGVCFLLSLLLEIPEMLPRRFLRIAGSLQMLCIVLVAAFLFANNVIPVY